MATRTLLVRELRSAAAQILAENDRSTFIAPSPRQYPGQWNWDAALISIGLAHLDSARARHEISQLLRGQWADGLLPHIVFWDAAVDYLPGPEVWHSVGMEKAPQVAATGITQPPVLATAVRMLHEHDPDPSFLERVLPAIEGWHRWLDDNRRPNRGLVSILHPWESGSDNSPRFDRSMQAVPPTHATALRRRDQIYVPSEQRPTDEDYHRYLHLVESLRRDGYRPQPGQYPFVYGDVGFTSILLRAEEDLAALWREVGADATPARARSESLRQSFGDAWDPTHRAFLDYDYMSGSPVPASAATSASLLPVFGGVDADQTGRIREQIWDESTFGPSSSHPWSVTSVAKSSPTFDSLRYWRGPVWVNMNWFLIRGLQSARLYDDADRLREHTLDLVSENGMHEYYDPVSGRGLGSPRFSWTAALTIDLIERP